MKYDGKLIKKTVMFITPLAVIVACGLGNNTNNLPNQNYSGTISPAFYGTTSPESIVAQYNTTTGLYNFYDYNTQTVNIIESGSFTNPISNNPCFTGNLPTGVLGCTSNSTVSFYGCGVSNNTATNRVVFTASNVIITDTSGNTCYASGGSVYLNNYGGTQ